MQEMTVTVPRAAQKDMYVGMSPAPCTVIPALRTAINTALTTTVQMGCDNFFKLIVCRLLRLRT